jgi:phosphoribosyl 1,2-cyclic phosphate phosphodiesterase
MLEPNPMHITFLGTGTSSGVPVISCKCDVCTSSDKRDSRLRTSILIQVDGNTIVIDSGPDFRQQMLENKVDDISAIVFTHEHKDHVAGLDDVRPYNFIHKKHINVYAEARVQKALRREFAYIFAEDRYPGLPQIKMHLLTRHPFRIGNTRIIPIRAYHYRLPIFGFRINNFAYLTDVKTVPDEEKAKLKGLDVLVVTALHKEKHVSHMNLEESLAFIDEIKPQKTYLTHLSHSFGLHAVEEPKLPENVYIAYDGLKTSV